MDTNFTRAAVFFSLGSIIIFVCTYYNVIIIIAYTNPTRRLMNRPRRAPNMPKTSMSIIIIIIICIFVPLHSGSRRRCGCSQITAATDS